MGPELSSPERERPVGRGQRTDTYVREAQQRVEEGRPPVPAGARAGGSAAWSWLSRWGVFAAILLVCLVVLAALGSGLLG